MAVRTVPDPLIGKNLGNYRVIDRLGEGGMGVVYRAEDLTLGRQVALKVLPSGSASNTEAVERFRREARTASSLNHPNICTIYGFDDQGGQLYLTMELLDGEPLDEKLMGKPLDLRLAIDIGNQIADALDAAHTDGVLHRDIKPANIFLTKRGQAKVLDFGLAKLAPSHRRAAKGLEASGQTHVPELFTSAAGTTVGTIAYMSPEQARGEDVDPRTDLFSFGVVMYELLTGRQSFPDSTTAVVFDGILNREPAPPSTLNGEVPAELDRIVLKALEKDRTLRYQTAADIGADLKRLRRDSTTRQSVAVALPVDADSSSATVVIPSGTAFQPVEPLGGKRLPAASRIRAVTKSAVRSPRVWGASAAVVVFAVIAASVGAYLATRGGSAVDPSTTDPTAEAVGAEATTGAPPLEPASPVPPPAKSRQAGASGPTTRPAPAPPPTPSPAEKRDAEATVRLDVARAKIANHLDKQGLVDLQQIITDYPGSRWSGEASLLVAEVFERAERPAEAMAAYVEFESRLSEDARVADSKLRRAALLLRSRQPNAVLQTRDLLREVVRDFPGSEQAGRALQDILRIETEQRDLREVDPVLKIQVPAPVVTLRMIIEQFPDSLEAMAAHNRLATMLAQMDRHADAAEVLEGLGAHFTGNPMEVWFRLGEIYERQLNDPERAKAAYAKVPENSNRYDEAQRRLRRR